MTVDPNHLLRLLNDIETGYTILSTNPQYAVRVIGEQARFGSTAYESRPPLNVAALDLTVDASDDSIPGELTYWVRRTWIRLRQPLDGPTVTDLIGYLRRHNHWTATQPWADDYQKRLTSLRGRLRATGNAGLVQDTFEAGPCLEVIHDVTPPRPCVGTVHVTRHTDPTAAPDQRLTHRARCDTCNRVYDAQGLTLLMANQEATA